MERFVAVLWDADGVMQHARPGWRERLEAIGGPGFAEATFTVEEPATTGAVTMQAALEELLAQWPVAATVDDVLAVWDEVDVDPGAVALVEEVRARGIRRVLATNQQDSRTRFTRTVLGYDRIMDLSCYSNELGVRKPSPEYFGSALAAVAADLDVDVIEPERVVFLDDAPANVDAAALLGICAVLHDPSTGADGLLADLASVGLDLAQT